MTQSPTNLVEERSLLAAARAGNEPAFGRFVEGHRPEMELYCRLMLGSCPEAKDMVDETVLRAWRGLQQVEPSASARVWLFRIATQVCLEGIDRHGCIATGCSALRTTPRMWSRGRC